MLEQRSLQTMKRFLSKTAFNNGCVEWQGMKSGSGYGKVAINKQKYLAHRIAYCWANSVEIESANFVCHSCDNPCCVNPDHLWLGSVHDNNNDALAKGRLKIYLGHTMNKGSRNGQSKLTEAKATAIRAALAEGKTQQAVAKTFGVCQSVVSHINTRKLWNHAQ